MKADILKLLLQSHAESDESSFRRAALQLAAAESTAGHVRVAEEIRAIIAKMPATSTRNQGPVVDIAAPRGELADILEGGHREERLRDIVLRPQPKRRSGACSLRTARVRGSSGSGCRRVAACCSTVRPAAERRLPLPCSLAKWACPS